MFENKVLLLIRKLRISKGSVLSRVVELRGTILLELYS